MKKMLLSVACMIMATFVFAGHGYYGDGGSFVNFNANGAGFTNYKVGQCNTCGALPGFSGISLGTNLSSLLLGNIEQNTYENGGDDVLDHGSFYYVVYPTGSRPATPVYTAVLLSNAIYNNGGTGNERRSFNPGTQLINGLLASTNYTIEVYYQSNVTYNGGSTGHTISPQANGGTNYDAAPTLFTATFTTGAVLAANNIAFSNVVKNNTVVLSWKLNDQDGIKNYVVERAADGINFSALATIAAGTNTTYSYTDAAPVNGLAYYRIKAIPAYGQPLYSDIINAAVKSAGTITVSTTGNSLQLNLKNIAAGTYALLIINNSGQRLYTAPLVHDGSNKAVRIDLPVLAANIYRLILTGNTTYSQSFIK